jgi:hypothetical protein
MNSRNLRRCVRLFAACATLASADMALAGPPFLTDDPEPVEYQHHEFYLATQQVRTQDGRSGTLPHVEFNYGAAPDLQLHILAPFAFNSPGDGPRQKGLGDVELGGDFSDCRHSYRRCGQGTRERRNSSVPANLAAKEMGRLAKLRRRRLLDQPGPKHKEPLVRWLASAAGSLGAPDAGGRDLPQHRTSPRRGIEHGLQSRWVLQF